MFDQFERCWAGFEHAIELSTLQHKKLVKMLQSCSVGFNKKDVEVEFEDNLLTVRTKQINKSEDKNGDGEIIHKGIFKDNCKIIYYCR